MITLLNGKECASIQQQKLMDTVRIFINKGIKPCISIISIGTDEASLRYIKHKIRVGNEMNITVNTHQYSTNTYSQDIENEVLELLKTLSMDVHTHGIILQMPLPKGYNTRLLLNTIAATKDIDGLTDSSQMALYMGYEGIRPATPKGIITLLDYYNIPLEGASILIIGRSHIVSKPLFHMLLQRNSTITIAHSYTKNIDKHCKNKDIIISAVGKYGVIESGWASNNTVFIDVGITKNSDNTLSGDIKYTDLDSYSYTPVPGGIGPMTLISLMENTVDACYKQCGSM